MIQVLQFITVLDMCCTDREGGVLGRDSRPATGPHVLHKQWSPLTRLKSPYNRKPCSIFIYFELNHARTAYSHNYLICVRTRQP